MPIVGIASVGLNAGQAVRLVGLTGASTPMLTNSAGLDVPCPCCAWGSSPSQRLGLVCGLLSVAHVRAHFQPLPQLMLLRLILPQLPQLMLPRLSALSLISSLQGLGTRASFHLVRHLLRSLLLKHSVVLRPPSSHLAYYTHCRALLPGRLPTLCATLLRTLLLTHSVVLRTPPCHLAYYKNCRAYAARASAHPVRPVALPAALCILPHSAAGP